MNMNKSGTSSANQRAKLLAGFVAIAMVVCVLCVVLPASDAADQETDADTQVLRVTIDGQSTVYKYSELSTAVNVINAAEGNVTVDVLNDFTANLTNVGSTSAAMVLKNENPDASITINGNNHTISGIGNVSEGVDANMINIEYSAADFTISDLKIDGKGIAHHGINIYDVEGTVTLDGVSAINNKATGITLNQATKVIASDITATNNVWGAINVDNGSALEINGNNNLGEGFQIWSEDANTEETGSSVTGDAFDDYQYGWTKTGTSPVTDGAIWFANGTITGDFVLGGGNGIIIPADKTLTVAEGASLTIEDDGTLTKTGELVNNGEVIAYSTTYDYADGDIFVNASGTRFTVFVETMGTAGTNVEVTFGVNIRAPVYDGNPVSVQIDLSPNAIIINGDGLSIDADAAQTASINNMEDIVDVGEYTLQTVVYVSNTGSSAVTYFTVPVPFSIQPAEYKINATIANWSQGAQPNDPSITVNDVFGEPATDVTVEYDFVNAIENPTIVTDDAYDLTQGIWYLRVTASSDDPNYEATTKYVQFQVTAPVPLDSAVEFAAVDNATLGLGDDILLQSNVLYTVGKFTQDTEAMTSAADVDMTGFIYQLAANQVPASWGFISAAAGYYLGFSVTAGQNIDLSDAEIDESDTNLKEITVEDAPANVKYYVYYLGTDLSLYDSESTADDKKTLQYNIDFDGTPATGDAYLDTTYTFKLDDLNQYRIILNDSKNTENYEYRLGEGKQLTLIAGAGAGFQYWTTEDKSPVASFNFGSIMTVSSEFDTNNDNVIELTAYYGEGSGDITIGEPATNAYVGIIKDDANKQFIITLVGTTANGGYGYIPTGSVTIEYTYLVEQTIGGQTFYRPVTDEVSVTVAEGKMIVESGAIEGFDTIISAKIIYGADDDSADGTNSAIYTPNLTATTE